MYNPKIWYTGDIVTSGGLNNMEQGIAQNAHEIETINDGIEDLSADATELKNTLNDVKSDLMVMDDAVVYDYTKDTSVSHTSIPTQNTEVNWESVVITCEEGDQFYVKGKGGNSTLLWMFGDSNGAYILDYSATQQLLATDYIKIIAPPNAHYLCVNNKYTEAKGGVIKASSTRINSVKKELLYTENAYDTVDYIFQYGFTVGALTNTGSVNRSDTWKTTPFIPVAERKKYKVSSSQTGFTVLRAAYDSSKTLVAFAAFTMDTLERDWNIPANVSYVKFSIHNEINDFSFRLWDSKIEALESYVGEPIFVKLEQGTFGASGEDVNSATMTRSSVITLDGTIKVCVNKGYRLYIIPASDYTKTDYAITDNTTIKVSNYKCRIKCAKLTENEAVTPTEANANVAFIKDTPVINLSDERIQPLCVSAYNVGHFSHGTSSNPTGTAENLQDFRDSISNLKSDIILLSENDMYYDANSSMEIYDTLYSIFPYYRSGDKHGYGCLGILSKWEIVEVKQIAFASGTVLGTYIYDVTININNRIVHFLPVHLDHWSITLRRNQIQELIDYCADYEYCIIGGDMNPENKVDGQVPSGETPHGVWQEDWALFKNAGYVMANSDYFGDKTTFPGNSWPDGLAPQDNIFVKGTTGKIDYVDVPTFDSSDHYPITAHITLY